MQFEITKDYGIFLSNTMRNFHKRIHRQGKAMTKYLCILDVRDKKSLQQNRPARRYARTTR